MSNGHDKSALLFGYGVTSHQLCRGFPIDKIASATNALSWWMSVPTREERQGSQQEHILSFRVSSRL